MKTSTPEVRNRLGCTGFKDKAAGFFLAVNNEVEFKVNACLGNLWNSEVFFWMGIYRFFKKGAMPFEGTVLDQPAKVIDLFNLFEAMEAEELEKQQAIQNQKAKK